MHFFNPRARACSRCSPTRRRRWRTGSSSRRRISPASSRSAVPGSAWLSSCAKTISFFFQRLLRPLFVFFQRLLRPGSPSQIYLYYLDCPLLLQWKLFSKEDILHSVRYFQRRFLNRAGFTHLASITKQFLRYWVYTTLYWEFSVLCLEPLGFRVLRWSGRL